MIELLTLLRSDGMKRSLHTLPQLMHSFVGIGYSFDLCFTSSHTCKIGIRSRDLGGQVSTSKFCIDYHYLTNFAIYDTRRAEMVPFYCLHDPILKNAKI